MTRAETVTSTLEFFDHPTPGFTWTIRGWRGKATANAARRGRLRKRLSLLKRDGEQWRTLLVVAEATHARHDPAGKTWRDSVWAMKNGAPFRVTVEEWGKPPRDVPNVSESIKRGIDALVLAGWIPGDGPNQLQELVVRDGRPAAKARCEVATVGVRLVVEAITITNSGGAR